MALINTTRFFRYYCYFRCGTNHVHYYLVTPFLKSELCPCYLGCRSNRLCLEICHRLFHILISYFIIWLLEGSLESNQSSLTMFFSNWCHITDSSYLYFVTQCVSIGPKEWSIENSWWNWLNIIGLNGWLSPFLVKNGKVQKINADYIPPNPQLECR